MPTDMETTATQKRDRLLLMRRTAWLHTQNREPSPADEKYIPDAIRMLTYIAVLGSVIYDMESELSAAGLLRHQVKRRVEQVKLLVSKTHAFTYQMLRGASALAGRQYNDFMERAYEAIDTGVLLNPPQRSYSITMALCRLIDRYNNRLSNRYRFQPAESLRRIPPLLSEIKIPDARLDDIIDLLYSKTEELNV